MPVRHRLADLALSAVDYATHHLVEGLLLGDLRTTTEALGEARTVVEAAPDPSGFEDMLAEVEEYEALLHDWESYLASPQATFPEWCAARRRPYQWPIIVYHDK